MASLEPRPRGRPPVGYSWVDGSWVSEAGEPYSATHQREKRLGKRRLYERRRYWDSQTRVRIVRLERSARAGGKEVRVKPLQLKLDEVVGVCVHPGIVEIARDINMLDD